MKGASKMTISVSSAPRLAAGAMGASAVAGALLFGATPVTNAAPAYIPAVQGPAHFAPAPAKGGGGGHGWGPGGGHGGWGHGGHGGWGRGDGDHDWDDWGHGGWGWWHPGWWW